MKISPAAVLRAAVKPYLHADDPCAVDVAFATVVGNAGPGDPLWLLLVNPPGTGKTEMVAMFREIRVCGWLGEVTENTFLSGLQRQLPSGGTKSAREHSLLFRWTDPQLRGGEPIVDVVLVQDLTGLVTSRREKRDAVFGQLRQIYDGRFIKATGMGEDLVWEGRLGLLGAVTPRYDEVAELNSVLGERFVLYRPARRDPAAEAMAALARTESEETKWRDAIAGIAAQVYPRAVAMLPGVIVSDPAKVRLVELAQLTAVGRAAVTRDATKIVQVMPEAEGPARLALQFQKLLRGLCAVRATREPGGAELAVIAKVARDSIPATRLTVLRALGRAPGENKRELARRVGLPPSTVMYILEDLRAVGLVEGGDEEWQLDDEWAELACRAGFSADDRTSIVVTEREGDVGGGFYVGLTSRDQSCEPARRVNAQQASDRHRPTASPPVSQSTAEILQRLNAAPPWLK
jgi:DNA-binding transcriptional ArsR family regulator